MQYRIGILEKDSQYLERLMKFLQSRHGDSLAVETADGSETDWTDVVPELLGMEVSTCDALLVGDDIDVMEESLPAHVKLIRLTADAEEGNPYEISKYQRLAQIYEQIIAVCEAQETDEAESEEQEAEPEEEDTLTLFTESGEGEVYRIYRISDEEDMAACAVEMKMLENNRIPGLAEVDFEEASFRYHITGKVSLADFVAQNRGARGRNRLLRIFRNILDTLLGLEEYMLLADRVLLLPEEIYLDPANLETSLLYLPVRNAGIGQDAEQCLRCMVEVGRGLLAGVGVILPKEDIPDRGGAAQEEEEPPRRENAGSEIFTTLQQAAQERKELKRRMGAISELPPTPYLMRRKTGEKVHISKNIFKIGKDENGVDYCIRNNPTVSRNHADIVRKPDGFYIVDKGSLNHTFLNGKLVDPKRARKLKTGDLVQIADEVFSIHL
ncbi:MAG: FHA domain-containing protein [Roseburia sp.]|nr:FHA domain-containing protein [Roseburia sp.]